MRVKLSPLGVEKWQVGEWKVKEVGGVPSRRREVDQQKHGDGRRNWGDAVNNAQSRQQQLSLSVYVPIKCREKKREEVKQQNN